MNFNDIKVRLRGLEGRLLEDEIYKVVWEEIERGEMDPISQARAVEDGDGEDGKIKSRYIKHRVRRLNDELATQSTTSSTVNKKKRTSHCALCGAKRFFASNKSDLCSSCLKKVIRTN